MNQRLRSRYIRDGLRLSAFAAMSVVTLAAYSQTNVCGVAKVKAGSTCPTPQIEVNLSACGDTSKPSWTTQGQCEGKVARFKIDSKNFIAQGQVEFKDTGWDEPQWLPGKVTYEPKKKLVKFPPAPRTVAQAETAPTVETPAAVAPAASPVVDNSLAWKFNGFLETKFRTVTQKDGPSRQSENGFLIEDGAVYIEGKTSAARLFLDLPLSRVRETAGTSPDFTKSDGPNLDFARAKAQAFIEVPLNDSTLLQMGQFDTIYGFELNDSKDRFFSQTGVVYNNALPVTHTGLLLQHVMGEFTLKALLANPNNKGSFGTSTAGETQAESGFTIGWTGANFRALGGYLTRPKTDPEGKTKARTLTEVLVGATYAGFNIDIEYDIVNDPSKDKNTDLISDSAGTALMTHLTYDVNEKLKLGLRLEKTQKDVLSGGNFEETVNFAGFQYRTSDNLMFGGEFGAYDLIASENATATKSSLISFSAQFKF